MSKGDIHTAKHGNGWRTALRATAAYPTSGRAIRAARRARYSLV